MIDVDEIYKVPVVKNQTDDIKNNPCFDQIDQTISLCDVKNKNYEMRYRHVNQLLIRGDNIVLVSYAD